MPPGLLRSISPTVFFFVCSLDPRRPLLVSCTLTFGLLQALSLAVPPHPEFMGKELMRTTLKHLLRLYDLLFGYFPLGTGSEWRRRSSVRGTCSPKTGRKRPRQATKESIDELCLLFRRGCRRRRRRRCDVAFIGTFWPSCRPLVDDPCCSSWVEAVDCSDEYLGVLTSGKRVWQLW